MNRIPSDAASISLGKRAIAVERTPMIIRTAEDLRRLAARPQALRRLPPNGAVVAIPGVDRDAQNAFRAQIGRYVRACGCGAGGAAFLLTSAVLAFYLVVLARDHAWWAVIRATGAGVIAVPALTLAVKGLSLSLARVRFRRACARMLRLVAAGADQSPQGRPPHDLQIVG